MKKLFKGKGGKRGSAMVEASFVFPLTVLTLVALVQICIGMYGLAAMNAKTHLALREYAGAESGKESFVSEEFIPSDRIGKVAAETPRELEKRGLLFLKEAKASQSKEVTGGGLIKKSASYQKESSAYILRETEYMRWADLVREEKEEA